MERIWAVILSSFAATVCAASGTPGRSPLEKARAQIAARECTEALLALDGFAREAAGDPMRSLDVAQGYLYLGLAYACINEETLAIAKLRQAFDISPSLAETDRHLPPGFLTQQMQRVFSEAAAAHEKAGATARVAAKGRWWTGPLLFGAGGIAAGVGISRGTRSGTQSDRVNQPPTADFTYSPEGIALRCATRVTFQATARDSDDQSLSYAWSLEGTRYGPTVTHVFGWDASGSARLRVSDGLTYVDVQKTVMLATVAGRWRAAGTDSIAGLSEITVPDRYSCDPNAPWHPIYDTTAVWSSGEIHHILVGLAHPRRLVFQIIVNPERLGCHPRFDGDMDGSGNSIVGTLTCGAQSEPFTLVR
jgi:hypothetical protein